MSKQLIKNCAHVSTGLCFSCDYKGHVYGICSYAKGVLCSDCEELGSGTYHHFENTGGMGVAPEFKPNADGDCCCEVCACGGTEPEKSVMDTTPEQKVENDVEIDRMIDNLIVDTPEEDYSESEESDSAPEERAIAADYPTLEDLALKRASSLKNFSNSEIQQVCQFMDFPIAATSKKLMIQNIIRILKLAKGNVLYAFIAYLSFVTQVQGQDYPPSGTTVAEPQVRAMVEDWFASLETRTFLILLALLFGLFSICLFQILKFLVILMYDMYKRCTFKPSKTVVSEATQDDLLKMSSYEYVSTLRKYRREDGSYVLYGGSNIAASQESTQLGSDLILAKSIPTSTLQVFVDKVFVGFAFRFQSYMVTALHVADHMIDAEITVKCPSNGKTFTWKMSRDQQAKQSTDLLKPGFEGIVRTPFVDTAIIVVPQRMWSRLGDPSSVKSVNLVAGLKYSITVFGTRCSEPENIYISRGLLTADGTTCSHTASTTKGFSGTAGYIGSTDVKQPLVAFVHYLGSSGSKEPNTGSAFHPIAKWVEFVAGKKSEDSEEYFRKFAIKHIDEIVDNLEKNCIQNDPYNDDLFYMMVNGKMREFSTGEIEILNSYDNDEEELEKRLSEYSKYQKLGFDFDQSVEDDRVTKKELEEEERQFHTQKRFGGLDLEDAIGEPNQDEIAKSVKRLALLSEELEKLEEISKLKTALDLAQKKQKDTAEKNKTLTESAGKLAKLQKETAEKLKKIEKLKNQESAEETPKSIVTTKGKKKKKGENPPETDKSKAEKPAAEAAKSDFPTGSQKSLANPKSSSARGSQ